MLKQQQLTKFTIYNYFEINPTTQPQLLISTSCFHRRFFGISSVFLRYFFGISSLFTEEQPKEQMEMSIKQAERDGLEDGWSGWKKEKQMYLF